MSNTRSLAPHCSSRTAPSVVNRLIRQLVHLPVKCQISRRMQLRHENYDHLLFRINGEKGVEESSPPECADTSQFGQRTLDAIHAEAQAESHVRRNFSQLIMSHQFDRLSAEQARIANLSFIEHHLAEPRIVHCCR